MERKVKLVLRRRMGQYLLEAIQGAVIVELTALRVGPYRAGEVIEEREAKVLAESTHYQVTVRA